MLLDTIVRLPQRLGEASLQPPPADGLRRAAVAVVLHGHDLLLMKRAERATDPWSGHVSLPGGRVEPEDPHLLATAIREAREELDIELSSALLLGSLPTIHPLMSGPRGIEVTPFVFAITERPELRISAEAQALFWLPLGEVAAGSLDSTFAHESGRAFPAWLYQGYTIWGMTMRVISELLAHLRAPSHPHASQASASSSSSSL
jgi:8-oxo-dGTP pyrophosphatase MutT (NUDIX family)